MGIANDKIIVSTEDKMEALVTLLKTGITEESQIVTFFCGTEATPEEVEQLEDIVAEINPDVEVEIVEGKQDIYSYIIAVE